jgi:hypothetical protein
MSAELHGVVRGAKHVGERAIFFDAPVFAEDFARYKLGTEVRVEITTERCLRQLAFVWTLAGKIAENSVYFLDKQDAMDNVPWGLKCRAHHAKVVIDPDGKTSVRPLSLKRLDGEQFAALLKRMVLVTCRDLLPGMEPGVLTTEIENMLDGRK